MPERTKFLLSDDQIPTAWVNVLPLLKEPLDPPLDPATRKPIGPEALAQIFPMSLLEQEFSPLPEIDIPGEVLDIYRLWRPTPLYRARRLEKALDTPARIYYKYEGVSPAGSHKPNTAVAQAYYNKQAGIKRLSTETGAGQWGSALALACRMFGLECTVYMVKVSHEQKPYRRMLMNTWGAEVFASPSTRTEAGRAVLAAHPDSPGSLGIAISEAVEDAATHADTNYALGSVLNHVMLHQTVIGQEAKQQMALAGDSPDVVIGCFGGGSNFAGIALPYVPDKLNGSAVRLVAVEPAACPSLTRGKYTYDFGDTAKLTPLLKMYTLGHDFVPPGIHAGGLRYHGASPLLSRLLKDGVIEARAYTQLPVFEAAVKFAQTEGILPAPESSHAIRAVFEEAEAARQEGKPRAILFCLSGHGHFDLASYDAYLNGRLQDFEHPGAAIAEAMEALP
ncbi:MAG TPA: TrpB-like pyridoxal phosphate-dependent enzyme [Bryobacteraceae bacterium]|nr:TrpB-like pyridoxal phosphate-dependent enzyme [Bryobacteraceae bacterium]HOQ45637.1 TrpB-like pyridoxal phosphate-dependent enzyme [Bryobacteraceae bacterium]HPQ14751.1 TrpB-like pyridoxal phosphate-dependent enzyme [Bryobacteraceae bacterium]HPU71637.1 TrpB-like pyridoxal phosphate-dependent enzyme [Bryobacteraceae bacterium]